MVGVPFRAQALMAAGGAPMQPQPGRGDALLAAAQTPTDSPFTVSRADQLQRAGEAPSFAELERGGFFGPPSDHTPTRPAPPQENNFARYLGPHLGGRLDDVARLAVALTPTFGTDASREAAGALREGRYGRAAALMGVSTLGAGLDTFGLGLAQRGVRGATRMANEGESASKGRARAPQPQGLNIYDPPSQPARPFEADYATAPQVGDDGRLLTDIDGRRIPGSAVIAGRRTLGGDDVALAPEEVDRLITQVTGREARVVDPKSIKGRAGEYVVTKDKFTPWERKDFKAMEALTGIDEHAFKYGMRKDFGDSIPYNSKQINIAGGLDEADAFRVKRHELGHPINDIAGTVPDPGAPQLMKTIPFEGFENDLRAIYSDLNTGPGAKPMTPKDFGYKPKDEGAELRAEAFRAYVSDPNYMKAKYPKLAEYMRNVVNNDPRLSKYLRLNTVIPASVIGYGALQSGNGDGSQVAALSPEPRS